MQLASTCFHHETSQGQAKSWLVASRLLNFADNLKTMVQGAQVSRLPAYCIIYTGDNHSHTQLPSIGPSLETELSGLPLTSPQSSIVNSAALKRKVLAKSIIG